MKVHVSKNQTKIYMAKKPIESMSSFTVAKPTGLNICFVFYNLPDLYETLALFFEKTFNKDVAVPQSDARKAAKETAEVVEKLMAFKGDYASS